MTDREQDGMERAIVKLTEALLDEIHRAREAELALRVEQASARTAWSRLKQLQRDVNRLIDDASHGLENPHAYVDNRAMFEQFAEQLRVLISRVVERG